MVAGARRGRAPLGKLALCACFAALGYLAASIAPLAALPHSAGYDLEGPLVSRVAAGRRPAGAPPSSAAALAPPAPSQPSRPASPRRHAPRPQHAPARRLRAAPAPERPPPFDAAAGADAFAARFLAASGLAAARPPLAPGASGEGSYRVLPYQILSWQPRAVLLPGFLSAARCDRIINTTLAKGLAKSPVSAEPGLGDQQSVRTSSGVFLAAREDPHGDLAHLEAKIAATTLLPADHGEPFNVLHYEEGQVFEPHMDAFDPEGSFKANNQRIATVITYLSDVDEGGETAFHWEGADGPSRAVSDGAGCGGVAFKVAPRKGDALLFYSLAPDGAVDSRSLHASCPVKRGEKWVATKWIFHRPFAFHNATTPAPAGAARGGQGAASAQAGPGAAAVAAAL
ncbi:MAG: hypothetical protein J3K34DRAFT_382451 [Monoraphidium minutum]|nr:MAG: hypothetical protein J3K34DRAFT_382451 [Monoraphidium minutum]